MRSRKAGEAVAILDERPGRTLSYLYRRFLAGIGDGVYLTPPVGETATLAALGALSGSPGASLGFRIENARAVLSFGAPMLDGWGVPAEVNAARYRPQAPLRIIQVETKQSRTASLADMWLPVRPGTETALALGIAHVLAHGSVPGAMEDAAEYRALLDRHSPEAVAATCGIPPETIEAAARMLVEHRPAVAIGGGDPGGGAAGLATETAIAGLNILLDAIGTTIVRREETPVPESWRESPLSPAQRLEQAPDHTIAVLFLGDSSSGDALPWPLIERKLSAGATVVSLSPYIEGPARRAQYIVPGPAFLEAFEEAPTPPVAASPSWAVARPLVDCPPGAVPAALLLNKLGGNELNLESLLKERLGAIQGAARGTVFTPAGAKPIGDFKDADALWAAITAGGVWTGETTAAPERPRRFGVREISNSPALAADAGYPLTLLPYALRGASGTAALPPLLTKVYQESLLRASAHQCRIHPETAAACHIADGDRVGLETRCGSCVLQAWVDASVMPGVIEAPAGPQGKTDEGGAINVCGLDEECKWRVSRARLRRLA
jgi:hypothetical protein